MSARTLSAIRQAVYTALTSPLLTYTVNNGSAQTLPAANVFPMAPFDMGDGSTKPDPLVNFQVTGRGKPSLQLSDRRIVIKVWVSTASGSDDTVTEIMAAIYGVLESPNAEGVSPLSRAATGSTLAATIREVRETESIGATFEMMTQRIYADATFSAIAI